MAAGGGTWGKDVVDIRSVLPSGLLRSAYVTQIGYVRLCLPLQKFFFGGRLWNIWDLFFNYEGSTPSLQRSSGKPFKRCHLFISLPVPARNKNKDSLPKTF
jgi:hypothetical protein